MKEACTGLIVGMTIEVEVKTLGPAEESANTKRLNHLNSVSHHPSQRGRCGK